MQLLAAGWASCSGRAASTWAVAESPGGPIERRWRRSSPPGATSGHAGGRRAPRGDRGVTTFVAARIDEATLAAHQIPACHWMFALLALITDAFAIPAQTLVAAALWLPATLNRRARPSSRDVSGGGRLGRPQSPPPWWRSPSGAWPQYWPTSSRATRAVVEPGDGRAGPAGAGLKARLRRYRHEPRRRVDRRRRLPLPRLAAARAQRGRPSSRSPSHTLATVPARHRGRVGGGQKTCGWWRAPRSTTTARAPLHRAASPRSRRRPDVTPPAARHGRRPGSSGAASWPLATRGGLGRRRHRLGRRRHPRPACRRRDRRATSPPTSIVHTAYRQGRTRAPGPSPSTARLTSPTPRRPCGARLAARVVGHRVRRPRRAPVPGARPPEPRSPTTGGPRPPPSTSCARSTRRPSSCGRR